MENVEHHLYTHITVSKKSKKKKQAPSKLVQCALCGSMIHTRGLHSHMRLVHHVVMEKVTKVVISPTVVKTSRDLSQPDEKHMKTTGVDLSRDLSQDASSDLSQLVSHDLSQKASNDYSPTVKIVEEITSYKPVKLVPGSRGGKIQTSFADFMDQMNAHVAAGVNTMLFDRNELTVDDIIRSKRKRNK